MTNDLLHRDARTRPNSYDPETRTVSAVIATPTPVPRRDARGPFLEVLTADTLDLSSVGRPSRSRLTSNRIGSRPARAGSVHRPGGWQRRGRPGITSAEDAAPVVQRIADGTVTGVSIGYRVAGWTEKTTPEGRVKTPTRWHITEVTLTSNPADPSARIRQKGNDMPDTTPETVSPEAAEQTRRSDIRTLVREAQLGPEIADDLIDAGADMTRAKAEVYDAVQERRRSAPIIRTHTAQNDDPAVITRRQ